MGKSPRCGGVGLRKGPWTPDEDHNLVSYIKKHGPGNWRTLPKFAGLNRYGKSCRLRWTNYLRPDIKRGKFTSQEEQTILNLHAILGNKWSTIASQLPGCTDNEIKNFWNTHLKKKLIRMGFDPVTHQPHTDIFMSLPHFIALANLRELVVKHNNSPTNLQSELAKLQYLHFLLHPPNTTTPTLQDTTNTTIHLLKALFPMNVDAQNPTTPPTQQLPNCVDNINLPNNPNRQGEPIIPDSPWLVSASFHSPPDPDHLLASMANQLFQLNEATTNIGAKHGGDSSTAASTSEGGSNIINSSFWSDLLNQIDP